LPTIQAVRVVSRAKSGLWVAGGFALCVVVLALVASSVPILGFLIYGALYWSSPFTWAWALIAGIDAPWPVEQSRLLFVMAAPLPFVGLLIGYLWPLKIHSWKQVLHAIGMRFAISFPILGILGVAFFVLALRK
jgi:hypothetical protein